MDRNNSLDAIARLQKYNESTNELLRQYDLNAGSPRGSESSQYYWLGFLCGMGGAIFFALASHNQTPNLAQKGQPAFESTSSSRTIDRLPANEWPSNDWAKTTGDQSKPDSFENRGFEFRQYRE